MTCAYSKNHKKLAEPPNIGLIKLQVLDYINSGSYDEDIIDVVENAKNYLNKRVTLNRASANPQKLAIIIDIDETALSNIPTLLRVGFSRKQKYFCPGAFETRDLAIPQVLSLFNQAKALGVSVFFISGRSKKGLSSTIQSLHNVGYKGWAGIYLIPSNYRNKAGKYSIVSFKAQARNKITNDGYVIVLNLGDQNSDFEGGNSGKVFKLPNPFYFTP